MDFNSDNCDLNFEILKSKIWNFNDSGILNFEFFFPFLISAIYIPVYLKQSGVLQECSN